MKHVNNLTTFFKDNNVPDWYYIINSLGHGDVDGIAFENDKWITYYSERGKKRNIIEHEDELSACLALYNIVHSLMLDDGVELPDFNSDDLKECDSAIGI